MNLNVVMRSAVVAAGAMALGTGAMGLEGRSTGIAGGRETGRKVVVEADGGVAGGAPATCGGCEADLNFDGQVDGADLGLLLAAWDTASPLADLNGSGKVDGADLGLLLSEWGACNAPPVNDLCGNAVTIGLGETPFCTVNATSSGPDACIAFGSGQINHDVWFRYTAVDDGVLVVSTCDSADFDTKLAVYGTIVPNSCACPGGFFTELLTCDDDTVGCGSNTTKVIFVAQKGFCYTIRVGGFGSAVGTGTLHLDFESNGDSCFTGTLISNNSSVSIESTTASNTGSVDDSAGCGLNDIIDEWYSYVVPCDGAVVIDTFGSVLDTVLSVFTGTCDLFFTDLTQIGCNDDYDANENGQIDVPSEWPSRLMFTNLAAGETIRIRVAGYNGSTGDYTLHIVCTNCCESHSGGGCTPISACEDCVCLQDSFCCEVMWDSLCAAAADGPLCDSVCPCD